MRQLEPGLAAALSGGVTTLCLCWKLTRADGLALGFTDHDRDLELDGLRFRAVSGTASDVEMETGFSPGNLEVAGALSGLDAGEIAAGLYDGATAEIWLVDWTRVDGRLLLKSGRIGAIRSEGQAFRAELVGLAEDMQVPRGRIYQHGCDALPGDARCGINLADPPRGGVGSFVRAEAEGRVIRAAGLQSRAAGWFDRGVLELATGERLEVRRHTISQSIAALELWRAPTWLPEPGSRLKVSAGCDRAYATCRDKFNNHANFRGFPHMPGNDYLASYPLG